jgi:hypothetical protein
VPLVRSLVGPFGLVCGLTPLEHRFRIGTRHESSTAVTHDAITISPGSRFRAAIVLVIIANALQIVVFPLFVEGRACQPWKGTGDSPPYALDRWS